MKIYCVFVVQGKERIMNLNGFGKIKLERTRILLLKRVMTFIQSASNKPKVLLLLLMGTR